ncbi:MAG TPA: tRNA pseudouridine(38-40) synthase TruA [Steroidobacteraceae bacterium]|nr:tRNA pseudouridine(38-40) synthase TruA [Steroidobacteraceae bacterium]
MKRATRRLAVGVEYDGTHYAGWQQQPGLSTLQDCLQRALSLVADHAVTVTGAGRTDAGVHAVAQVAHFDTTAERPPRGWVLGANSHLPADIAVTWAVEVDPVFHARHAALARSYRYLILQRATRPAILRDRACWARVALDAAAMHEAAQALVGEHDFSSFRAVECQSPTAMRRLDAISVAADGPFVTVEVTANAFLHHMVRNIVGTLMEVGSGERRPDSLVATLAARDRTRAGVTAPAGGLYLWRVHYPDTFALPGAPAMPPWAMITGA